MRSPLPCDGSPGGSLVSPARLSVRAHQRRLVLVDAYWTRDKDPRVPLGHGSLLAALRARTKADVRSVVVPVNEGTLDGASIVASILDHARGLPVADVDVGFGVYVWSEEIVQSVIRQLRERGFVGRIILGGPQISYCGGGLERLYPYANVFVRGHGEVALCDLVADPGKPTIRGVHYAGTVDRNEQAEVPLTDFASPWLTGVISVEKQEFIRWETQRGCPYRCTFCQHRDADGRGVKRFGIDRILSEIELFCRMGVQDIAVLDPIFNISRQGHAVEVLTHFRRHGFRGRLSLQCRAELLTEEFLEVASNLNVRLELGLQTIHETEGTAVHRQNDLRRVEYALEAIRRHGVDHEVSIIFGLPTQTLASFKETVAWCLAQRIPVIRAFPLLVLRGTELERNRDRWGIGDDGPPMHAVVESATFTRADRTEMEEISNALHATIGAHPSRLEDLLHARPIAGRFRPASRTAVTL